MRPTIVRRYERLTIHSSTNACRCCSRLKDPHWDCLPIVRSLRRYFPPRVLENTVHWPLRLMERLCFHQHVQSCPRTLEDVDEPKKAAEKTINRSLRLTKRFCLHERLKGAERLKRFFTSRLTIPRHADWLSDRCSRLNDSNETADAVWNSSGRPTRPKAGIRTPIAFQENRQSAYSLARRRLLRECAPSVVDP